MPISLFRIVPYIMPKPGYKSITVSEHVYKKFFKAYEKNKKGLEAKGVWSFSSYLTSMMEEMMLKYEAFAKHAPYMEKLSIDQNRIVLKIIKEIELQK